MDLRKDDVRLGLFIVHPHDPAKEGLSTTGPASTTPSKLTQ